MKSTKRYQSLEGREMQKGAHNSNLGHYLESAYSEQLPISVAMKEDLVYISMCYLILGQLTRKWRQWSSLVSLGGNKMVSMSWMTPSKLTVREMWSRKKKGIMYGIAAWEMATCQWRPGFLCHSRSQPGGIIFICVRRLSQRRCSSTWCSCTQKVPFI